MMDIFDEIFGIPQEGSGQQVVINLPGIGLVKASIITMSGSELSGPNDFSSAHLKFNTLGTLPDELQSPMYSLVKAQHATECEPCGKGYEAFNRGGLRELKRSVIPSMIAELSPDRIPLQEVMRTALSVETTLDASQHIIHTNNSTRDSIDTVLRSLTSRRYGLGRQNKRNRVALALPNWHWHSQLDGVSEQEYALSYLEATSEDCFVDQFGKALREHGKGIGALLIVDPQNPLLYQLSEDAARALDALALEHDVPVVVDDVMRGTMMPGERDSVARYFTKPIVVEGTSKRFGDGEWNTAYVLVPDVYKRRIEKAFGSCTDEVTDQAYGCFMDHFFEHATTPIADEVLARNAALDEALQGVEGTQITRPSPTFLTTRIDLSEPENGRRGGELSQRIYERAFREEGLLVAPTAAFYLDGSVNCDGGGDYLRITTGRSSVAGVREVMRKLTPIIQEELSHG